MYKTTCKGDKQAVKDIDEIIDYLISRKNFLFKDDKRFVTSYKVTKTKESKSCSSIP